jgi:hypothetical protein
MLYNPLQSVSAFNDAPAWGKLDDDFRVVVITLSVRVTF